MNKAVRLALIGLLAVAAASASADVIVKLYAGNKLVACNPAARVRQGVTYAPLRAAAQAVGAHVDWNAKSQTAVVCNDQQCVPVRKSQGIIVNNSLLVPVRLLGEALGCKVQWDGAARAVRIKAGRTKSLLP